MENNINNNMSETLKIRLAARCEAAGRPENEDNFQVAQDLSVSNSGFETDKVFPLGTKGTLLLVCDGMGGMNAGEVASAVGVETIKNFFAPQQLTAEILANDESICSYMKRAIITADSRIKEEASKDDAKKGMGSTAVMAWLLGQKVYVAWCGDSRCYRYNPSIGLEQLSHDHSYVQDLVDTGQLSADLAFDHPNKNIITRSLGDPRGAAKPDARVFNLRLGDVILLCSDGLSDCLRDNEIEQSISRSLSSMAICRDALWNDSKQAGWHDNVTVVLAQVVNDNMHHPQSQPQSHVAFQTMQAPKSSQPNKTRPVSKSKFSWKIVISILAAILLVGAVILFLMHSKGNDNTIKEVPVSIDQVRPQLSEIISPNNSEIDNILENQEDLLNILKTCPAAKDDAIRLIEEKKLTIESKSANDSITEEVSKERQKVLNNIISKINKQ